MRTVFKYILPVAIMQDVKMPIGAQILHIGSQIPMDGIVIWALIDTNAELETRTFLVTGTGHAVPDEVEYIGTSIMEPFVWRVWEEHLPNNAIE